MELAQHFVRVNATAVIPRFGPAGVAGKQNAIWQERSGLHVVKDFGEDAANTPNVDGLTVAAAANAYLGGTVPVEEARGVRKRRD